MTSRVYPRLPTSQASALLPPLRAAYESGGLPAVRALSRSSHPKASPVPTGGRVATLEQIAAVREEVRERVAPWFEAGQVPSSEVSRFDALVGDALHETLKILPADAAHVETWNFLTLVLLPDVAVLRFPQMHPNRMLGTDRNALRRTWIRREVLGPSMTSTSRQLGEDELVGMFERSALARNRELLRQLAQRVLAYDGDQARSQWARDLYKRVTFATGPRLLDCLEPDELAALIDGAESLPPKSPPAAVREAFEPNMVGRSPDVSRESGRVHLTSKSSASRPAVQPLEKTFNRLMVQLYHRARRELGYSANYFVGMLSRDGGVVTARKLVLSDHPSDGFTYLWERGRLDLSVEALVVRVPYSDLFDDEVIDRAQSRLAEYGYRPQ